MDEAEANKKMEKEAKRLAFQKKEEMKKRKDIDLNKIE